MASIVLPRPGQPAPIQSPIKAPSETAFTSTFGHLLPKASYIETPHGRAAYYSIPPTDTTPGPISRVLFVHGVQTPALGLYPLASALSSKFPSAHCVLVDLWGHGLTDTPLVPHEAGLFHFLLHNVLNTLGWDDAHVLGYSFGGSTTASFAAISDRVRSMVLVAPAGLVRSGSFSETERKYLAGGEGIEEKAKEWVLEWLEDGELVVPSDWEERVQRGEVVAEAVKDWEIKNHAGHMASVVGIVRDGGVLDKHDEFAAAAKKGIPGFCVLGELDGLCSVQDLAEVGMHNVAVVVKAGHGVVRSDVPEVAGLIEEFWNGL